jgi:hypothetical protein
MLFLMSLSIHIQSLHLLHSQQNLILLFFHQIFNCHPLVLLSLQVQLIRLLHQASYIWSHRQVLPIIFMIILPPLPAILLHHIYRIVSFPLHHLLNFSSRIKPHTPWSQEVRITSTNQKSYLITIFAIQFPKPLWPHSNHTTKNQLAIQLQSSTIIGMRLWTKNLMPY